MTAGKTTALVLGLAGAFALGVWASPYVIDRMPTGMTDRDGVTEVAKEETPVTPKPAIARRTAPTPIDAASVRSDVLPASSADLHARLRPVLNRGTNLRTASEGFSSAEQFAAVAHASRNTGVQFMVLKHRVLSEGKSLTAAIRQEAPKLDAAAEVLRALTMARGDVASIAG